MKNKRLKKNQKKEKLKKERDRKKIKKLDIILPLFILFAFLIWIGWVTFMVIDLSHYPNTLKYQREMAKYYQIRYVEEFYNDSEVINVVYNCQNNQTVVQCVYDSIPFNWTDRYTTETLSPIQLVGRDGKGLCRDIAVFRKATFDKLGIKSKFKITQTHIYVIAYEGFFVYELDNSHLRKKFNKMSFLKIINL